MDPTSTLVKQKKTLIQAVKDADFAEMRRMRRLQQAHTKGEKETLFRRFEKERSMDQQRIENLASDFKRMEEIVHSGSFNSLTEKRLHNKSDRLLPKEHKNRFAGIDTHEDRVQIATEIIYHDCTSYLLYDFEYLRSFGREYANDLII